MSDFPKNHQIKENIIKHDRFVRSTFITNIKLVFIMVILFPIVYELTKYHWKFYDVYYIYYVLFAIFIMLFLLLLCSITEAEISDWFNKIDSDTIYLTILYISGIVCIFTIYMVTIDYAVCSMTSSVSSITTESCEYENLLEFLKDLAELIGSGAIPVLALIVEKYTVVKLETDVISSKLASQRMDLAHSNIFFVDAIEEDSELIKQVIDCLKSSNRPYLPPISSLNNKINDQSALKIRLKFCEDILVLCGSESFVFWVKNRLRFYSRHKLPTTRIFILCFNGLNAKFDEYKSSQDIAIIELPNSNIDCEEELISKITK